MTHFFLIILIAITGNHTFTKDIRKAVKAIQLVESEGNPNCIGDIKYKYNYSIGLGQIRVKTGFWIIRKLVPKGIIKKILLKELKKQGIKKILLDPTINTYLSRIYLKWLKKYHKGKIKQAIISYNTGQRAKYYVRNTIGMIYYRKVIKKYSI